MSQHLFATIVTATAVAANNRGEGDGSTLSTLQKITRGNDQYTTVSAEAIRWGLREYFQNLNSATVNRTFDPDKDVYNLKNERFSAKDFIDDDLFGYMDAKKQRLNDVEHWKSVELLALIHSGVILLLALKVVQKARLQFIAQRCIARPINTRSPSLLKL
jgi:hypothetical protein